MNEASARKDPPGPLSHGSELWEVIGSTGFLWLFFPRLAEEEQLEEVTLPSLGQ